MKKVFSIIFFLVLIAAVPGHAKTISGTVKDSKSVPVPGVVVHMENEPKIATVTDINGKWELAVPDVLASKGIIVCSCTGFKECRVPVAGQMTIDIVIEENVELLEEAVVVGYGAMRRSDLTGSVTSIRIDEDLATRSTTIDQMMQGRAAGVSISTENDGSPDAGVFIHIRGTSTFTENSDPLYVVDGIILGGGEFGLAGINPSDIASIEILKDASATAIYGSQGANGVILITTKQSNKSVPTIVFDAGVSIGNAAKKIRLMSFDEYVDMLYSYPDSSADTYKKFIFEDPVGRTGLKVVPVDWQDYCMRTAVSQRYNFSVNGKSKGLGYLFSLGYKHNEGVIKSYDSDGLTARLNMSRYVTKHLELSFKTNFNYTKTNIQVGNVLGGAADAYNSIVRSMMRSIPYMSSNEDEEIFEVDGPDQNYQYTPIVHLRDGRNYRERFRVTPSLSATVNITKWLTFKSVFGGDFIMTETTRSKSARLSYTKGNTASAQESVSLKYNFDNLLTAKGKWGRHNLTGTLGQTANKTMSNSQQVTAEQLKYLGAYEYAINDASPLNTKYTVYSESASSLLSFFTRAIYNYDERYILTGTLRLDGSSKFKKSNKWGMFPSFAFAWRISNEPWFRIPSVSNFKLRLGWGQVGNQAISNYQTFVGYSTFAQGNHFNGTGKDLTIFPDNIANENLKWETSEQINGGIDLSLWKGRLALTVDAYVKNAKDLLQSKNIARSSGFSTMYFNDGCITNKGLEFALDAVPVKVKDFELTFGGNISMNRNTITDIGESGSSGAIRLSENAEPVAAKYFYGSSLQSGNNTDPINIFIEGQSMGLFYGYVSDGIVQQGETAPSKTVGTPMAEGRIKYKDLNGNGYIDPDDRTIIGCCIPDFSYGFNVSATWKGVVFKINFAGAHGFDVFNLNNNLNYQVMAGRNSCYEAFAKAWTPENTDTVWPKIATTDYTYSDRFVEDGSYLKISSIQLSYKVPINKNKAKFLHGMNVSVSVGNPVMFTNYSGYSPLSNPSGNNIRRMGVEFNSIPYARTFDFDLKFIF